ncbi:MAG: hypothetical protein LBE21_00350 [Pseudomonadales bacterium]|jgi:cation:H+ antiporter|nr:hypothetical protein [Pseudomonadales bacterium]
MPQDLPLTVWILIFALATSAIWRTGVILVDATDLIDARWNLGEAVGGAVLLAIVTNLPEVAIMVSASLRGDTSVVVGNLIGGVALQTLVLVLLDCKLKGSPPLSHRAADLVLVLEGLLVVVVLTLCIMGMQLPATVIFERITPAPFLIALLWLFGLWLIDWASNKRPWHDEANNDAAEPPAPPPQGSLQKTYWIFAIAALITLIAGIALEQSGAVLARALGMNGLLFGATFLALVTALPQISTGLRAIQKGDYQLAVSDIFGGNIFLPVLLLPATLIAGRAILPLAHKTDIYLAALAILLTCVYLIGLIVRSKNKCFGMGPDSLAALVLYVLGMAGLFLIEA